MSLVIIVPGNLLQYCVNEIAGAQYNAELSFSSRSHVVLPRSPAWSKREDGCYDLKNT